MKPIGPYVAARDLTGDLPGGEVRTLHATDRLTGMPVLLHVLPRPVPLPTLPDDPALLPPSEEGVDGALAYVVTELPPHAQPASDTLLAARGALAGLAALHEAGLTHGGVGRAQLWSVDGRVALAGAGLPWGENADPEGDLRALTTTLEDLGGVPPALRGAPGTLSARELLARLTAGEPPHPPAPTPGSFPTAAQEPGAALPADVAPAESTSAEPAPAQRPKTVVQLDAAGTAGPAETPRAEAAAESGGAAPAGEPPAPPVPVVDLKLREDELAALEADQQALASVRESLQDTAGERPEPGAVPPQDGPPADGPAPAARPAGHVTPRRMVDKPIRIGWEEDHSWRVVRDGRPSSRPTASAPALPRWLLPALAALLVIAAVLWLLASRAAGTRTPEVGAGTCCDVRFTVRGSTGVPVRLSLDSGPAGAGDPSGRSLGTAPGTVHLPGPGTYTLRVAADGYTPRNITVTAPASGPVAIDLGP